MSCTRSDLGETHPVFGSVGGSVKRVGIDLGLRFTWVFRRAGDASSSLTFSQRPVNP
jgi:hypothetical protein